MEVSRRGKSVYVEAGFWLEQDNSIHLTFKGVPGFHVAVNLDPDKPNGHPTLYKRLARLLAEAGAPAPVMPNHRAATSLPEREPPLATKFLRNLPDKGERE